MSFLGDLDEAARGRELVAPSTARAGQGIVELFPRVTDPADTPGRHSGNERMAIITEYLSRDGLDVQLHGYLALARAWPLISGCQIGLALLQPMPNYVDSYPTKIFDYMGLGVPVLCSDFPLYRHLVEEVGCGRCVDPTRPDLIAEAIASMLDNPEELESMHRSWAPSSRWNETGRDFSDCVRGRM